MSWSGLVLSRGKTERDGEEARVEIRGEVGRLYDMRNSRD